MFNRRASIEPLFTNLWHTNIVIVHIFSDFCCILGDFIAFSLVKRLKCSILALDFQVLSSFSCLFTLGAGLIQNDVCFGFAARRKLLERARRAGLGGFKKRSGAEASVKEMWDGEEGKVIHGQVTSTEL